MTRYTYIQIEHTTTYKENIQPYIHVSPYLREVRVYIHAYTHTYTHSLYLLDYNDTIYIHTTHAYYAYIITFSVFNMEVHIHSVMDTTSCQHVFSTLFVTKKLNCVILEIELCNTRN
jgi:hypothetical protein